MKLDESTFNIKGFKSVFNAQFIENFLLCYTDVSLTVTDDKSSAGHSVSARFLHLENADRTKPTSYVVALTGPQRYM